MTNYWKPSAECKQYADRILSAIRTIGDEIVLDNNLKHEAFYIMRLEGPAWLDTIYLIEIDRTGVNVINHKAAHECFGLYHTQEVIELVTAIRKYIQTNFDEFEDFWQLATLLTNPYEPRSWHEVDMQRYMLELMVNSLRDSFNRKDYQHIDPVVIDIDEYFRRTFSMTVKYHGESFADIMSSAHSSIVIDYIKGSYVENVVDVMLTDIEKDLLETIVRLMNKYKRATTMMYPLRKASAYAMMEAIKTSVKTR